MARMNKSPAYSRDTAYSRARTPPNGAQQGVASPEEGEIVEAQPNNLAATAPNVPHVAVQAVAPLPFPITQGPAQAMLMVPPDASTVNRTSATLHARRVDRRLERSPYSSSPAVSYPTSPAAPNDSGPTNGTPIPQNTLPGAPSSTLSDTSDHYWQNAGPTPTPSVMRTPPPPDQYVQPPSEADEHDKDFERGLTEATSDGVFYGKLSTLASLGNDFPNARKRSFASILTPNAGMSPTTEHRIRTRNKRHRASLPNEYEVYPTIGSGDKNPWALSSDDEGAEGQGKTILGEPDATSTPVLRPVASSASLPHVPDDDFFLDHVNASGNPPTPYRMQNSSFLARLRRSAGEAKSQNRDLGRPATAADRSLSEKGGSSSLPRTSPLPFSSPLPPSSPILQSSPISSPSNTPTRTRERSTNHDTEDLMARSKMRLTSILSDPEGPATPRTSASASLQAQRARGGRISARTTHPDATIQGPAHAWEEREYHPPAARSTETAPSKTARPPAREGRARSPTERPSTTFLPLPNTRAALHLQQMSERAKELANTCPTSYLGTVGDEGSRRGRWPQRPDSGPSTRGHSRDHSAMDVAPMTPRSVATMEDQPMPPLTQRRAQSLSYFDFEEDEAVERGEHDPEPDQSPEGANVTAQLAIPTILTAAAPDIDRPMPANPWLTHRVYRDDPEAIIRGISRRWAQAIWGDPPRTSVLLETFNFPYTDSIQANRLMVETLRKAIYVIAGATNVSIVPPDVDPATSWRQRDAPRVWAVRGLTPEQEETLLSQFPWSLRAISFFAYKRAVTPDSWLFALDGFFDEDTQAIA
ncbi:hypothetical protein OH76DRAFT_1480874 [Lentinus brumalis]|uniref:Uncharacterized protein n=1 Tax=Lentinus brumalis TaxID=2498619 RepID=A0A371DIE7_9APHY|nr:hypothetical protein OH76DRAFT_1480874 [Polyporus brumalis]